MSETEPELIDGVPVLVEPRVVEPPRGRGPLSPLVVQSAAVAATSMVAGATAVALVRRSKGRRRARRNGRVLAPVLASRSFLIDVHVLGDRK
ncbi:MAG TPA: hypothetical protein VGF63_04660 [Solirubrobacteraceae bacterium]